MILNNLDHKGTFHWRYFLNQSSIKARICAFNRIDLRINNSIKKNTLGKNIIVTGALGNLGQAVVRKFLAEKNFVTGVIRYGSSSGKNSHENYSEPPLDLLSSEQCEEFTQNFFKEHGEIHVAVLTAGGFAKGDIATTSTSDIYKQYQLNFETAYNIARPVFVQMMKQKAGRIFLIGSRAGLDVSKAKGVTAYALSKSLLFRLAELMNAEAEGTGVVVSVIVPSTIDTPENRKDMPGADFATWVTPTQIADVIYFYSSQEADVIRQPVIKVYNKS